MQIIKGILVDVEVNEISKDGDVNTYPIGKNKTILLVVLQFQCTVYNQYYQTKKKRTFRWEENLPLKDA